VDRSASSFTRPLELALMRSDPGKHSIEARPACEEPLSTIQNTRRAEA
jgi:hypothetical protein